MRGFAAISRWSAVALLAAALSLPAGASLADRGGRGGGHGGGQGGGRAWSGGGARTWGGGGNRSGWTGGAARTWSGGGARTYSGRQPMWGGENGRFFTGGGGRTYGGGGRTYGGGGWSGTPRVYSGGHSYYGGGWPHYGRYYGRYPRYGYPYHRSYFAFGLGLGVPYYSYPVVVDRYYDVENYPPAGCYYYDPYCDRTFDCLDDYTAHLDRVDHPSRVEIIVADSGSRLRTLAFVGGYWSVLR